MYSLLLCAQKSSRVKTPTYLQSPSGTRVQNARLWYLCHINSFAVSACTPFRTVTSLEGLSLDLQRVQRTSKLSIPQPFGRRLLYFGSIISIIQLRNAHGMLIRRVVLIRVACEGCLPTGDGRRLRIMSGRMSGRLPRMGLVPE